MFPRSLFTIVLPNGDTHIAHGARCETGEYVYSKEYTDSLRDKQFFLEKKILAIYQDEIDSLRKEIDSLNSALYQLESEGVSKL